MKRVFQHPLPGFSLTLCLVGTMFLLACPADDPVDPVDTGTPDTPDSAVCGNSNLENGEECDDGNTTTEPCEYGLTSCTVCDSACNEVEGVTTYCGDNAVDASAGEDCDDGNTTTESCVYGEADCTVCDAACTEVAGDTSYCGDGVIDTDENEACDGAAVGQGTCPSSDFGLGSPQCDSDCQLDFTDCWFVSTVGQGISEYDTSVAMVADSSGLTHVVYVATDEYLRHAQGTGTENWTTETVDSDHRAVYVNIAVDTNDGIHAAYGTRSGGGGVQYAQRQGTTWSHEGLEPTPPHQGGYRYISLALGDSGQPQIAWQDNSVPVARYGVPDGTGAWELTDIDTDGRTGWEVHMSLAGDGTPVACYGRDYASGSNGMQCASPNTSGWVAEYVSATPRCLETARHPDGDVQVLYSGPDQMVHLAQKGAAGWSEELFGSEAWSVALAFDGDGNAHAAYITMDGVLHYIGNIGTTSETDISIGNVGTPDTTSWICRSIDLRIDSDGRVHLLFSHLDGDQVIYMRSP